MHHVYMLECADGTLYVGSTTDVKRRVHEHNHAKAGARYTKARRPVKLVYAEVQPSLSAVRKREAEIKRWSRSKKLTFIARGGTIPI